MTIDQLRQLTSPVPFQPFKILTSDGREYPVDHPENFWIPPSFPVIQINWEENLTMIDVSAVVGVQQKRVTIQ